MKLENEIYSIFNQYSKSFSKKIYSDTESDSDLLMKVFGITPELKKENMQYWGRELGMVWQKLVVSIFKHNHPAFGPALRFGADEPCDLTVGKLAIDTKYRVGSGDAGTLKKFKQYGALLRENGYEPVLLFLREDNLHAAITACRAGEWNVLTGEHSFRFIQELTGVDAKQILLHCGDQFKIARN